MVGTAVRRRGGGGGTVDSPAGDVGLDLAESDHDATVGAGHESGKGAEDRGVAADDASRILEFPVTDAVDENGCSPQSAVHRTHRVKVALGTTKRRPSTDAAMCI